jgi:hypothetical protein
MRWFETLIGVDFMAGLLQLIPYRGMLPMHSRLIWVSGVVIAGPLLMMALIESSELGHMAFWHVRILALWTAFQLTCIALQTQGDLTIPLNSVLLTGDALCFLLWIALFVLR